MRIAGIDPSLTNTGLALLDCSRQLPTLPIALHSIGWGGEAGASYLDRNRRGRDLASAVMSWLVSRSPDIVVIEAPIPRMQKRSGSVFDRWFLFELLLAECDLRKIECVVVNPRTRQAWLTGNGNAGKQEIHEAWRKILAPVKVINADIADALTLAYMAALRLDYELPFPVKDRHWNQLDSVSWPAVWPEAARAPKQLQLG